MGESEVIVLMIEVTEVTNVIKSPCLHLVGVLLVEFGNSVSYPGHLCSLFMWGEKKFIHKEEMLLTWQYMYFPGGPLGLWIVSAVVPGPCEVWYLLKYII